MTNFRMEIHGLIGASLPWSIGFYFSGSVSESAASGTFNTAAGVLFTDATNGLDQFMNAEITTTLTTVSTMSSTFRQTTLTQATLSHLGTDANASLPWNTAMVVTFRTASRTKFGHGRVFLPPFAEDNIASHVWKSTVTAKVAAGFQTLRTSMTSGGLTQFIVGKVVGVSGNPPFTPLTCTGGDVSDKPGQQRRRVSKVVPTRTTFT